ncbi:hypothetical protein CFC21_034712 [Triticum aestivum]|uniref:Uncharacterized protein n=3 Tax=Triticum TaxID=4564 RepID=A0A9R0RFC0_TRITD|nr:hypothetical protein CFC21_034712 [Triticum aestivum]VAH59059.1 unnamed protein product [Triticum turgidum subsp. durum]
MAVGTCGEPAERHERHRVDARSCGQVFSSPVAPHATAGTVASFRTRESPSPDRQTRHGRRLMAAPPLAAGRLRLRPRAGRAMMPLERRRSRTLHECWEQKHCTVQVIPTGFLSLSPSSQSACVCFPCLDYAAPLEDVTEALNGDRSPLACPVTNRLRH